MSNLISLDQIKRYYDVGGELVKALDGVDVSIKANDIFQLWDHLVLVNQR